MKVYKFLFIDDDPDESELFQIALVEIGQPFEHLTKKDGLEAINFLKTTRTYIPDYIFLDLNIPFIDGRECLREIRNLKHLSNTPVIIYSGISEKECIEELQSLSATHYMIKPKRVSMLAKLLSALLYTSDLPFLVEYGKKL